MAKKILIVDDSSLIRNVAQNAAVEAGYQVVLAANGAEGLALLEKGGIDLIFSDINMPVMNGLEMVEKIRELEHYKFTPIVMLTTESKPELKEQGKTLGVKAWFLKPFNKEKFLLVLSKLLG
jgi:two-component system, chemotaxis family, chemotaxis protein CheY